MRLIKIPRMATVVLALAVLAGSSLVGAAFLGKRAEPFTPPDASVQAIRTGGSDGEPILVAPSPQAPASISNDETVPASEQTSVVIPPVLTIGTALTAAPALPADPDLSVSFASPQVDLIDIDPSLDRRLTETDLSVSGLSLNVASAEATTFDLLGSQEVEDEISKKSEGEVGALGWWSENGYSPDNLTAAGLTAGTSSEKSSATDGSDKAKGNSSRGSGKSKGKASGKDKSSSKGKASKKSKGKASGKSKGKGPGSSSPASAGHSPKKKAPAKASAKPRGHSASPGKSSSKPPQGKKPRGRTKDKGKR